MRSTRSKGKVDKAYKAFIAEQPCVVCQTKKSMQKSRTEVAHCGPRGLGQKCDDRFCLPLCGPYVGVTMRTLGHHREGPESAHSLQDKFWAFHGLDKDALFKWYNDRYERTYGSKDNHA